MKFFIAFFIILTICFLCGCKQNSIIESIHEHMVENSDSVVDLSNFTDFDWDRALLFNTYVLCVYNSEKRDSIESSVNFQMKKLSFTEYELTAPLIFLKGDKIVHIEINYEETFPKDDVKRKKEKICMAHSCNFIDKIDRNDCVFLIDTTKYYMYRTIKLKK